MKECLFKRLRYINILTKKFLEKEYLQKRKSISQLQRELSIDWNTIKCYFKLHDIPLRSHKEQATISSPGGKFKHDNLLSKEFLIKEYIQNNKGIINLSRELKIDQSILRRYLVKNGIVIRSRTQQIRINNPPKEFAVNLDIKQFVNGLLLGDASIPKRRDGTSPRSLTQACKHKEYLEYIKKRFFEMDIICSPILSRWIKDPRCKNKGYNQHFLQTRRYKTFELFRERFYPKGKKIIPQDIVITKDLLLQLYLCDGNFYRHIALCLNAFEERYVLHLKKLIEKKLNIKPTLKKQKGQFMLVIKKLDTEKFLNYIGDCPVECYQYKWKDNESEEIKERKRLKARIRYNNNKNADFRDTISQSKT